MKSRAVQALLVLLGIGLFVFATLPAYRVAEGLRQDKANNDQTLALSAELKQNREDLQDRFNRITDEEREGLRKLLPDTLDNVRLVNDISDIAQGQGLQIRNIAVGESGGPPRTPPPGSSATGRSRSRSRPPPPTASSPTSCASSSGRCGWWTSGPSPSSPRRPSGTTSR